MSSDAHLGVQQQQQRPPRLRAGLTTMTLWVLIAEFYLKGAKAGRHKRECPMPVPSCSELSLNIPDALNRSKPSLMARHFDGALEGAASFSFEAKLYKRQLGAGYAE